ncbi:Hemicentin-1 [Bagarius yarrelli]|uniref:Hemicentin-1 n=1 Tax=Bagarius yarrelli TaxID=175774 RepID=A0A556V8S0_BAGYA|nr:Hemicentin-1 [Bagarius yarrelli]
MKIAVGEKVVITPTRIPSPPHNFIRWAVNTTTILLGPPSGVTVLPPYTDRASMDPSTLALELRNLLENDTGSYTLTIQRNGASVEGKTALYVLVPVSSVTIVPSQTELVEFNSTVSLVCSASGSSLSFLWLNGSSVVTADERIQLTDNNSSLGITSVIRGDTGPYQCEASNFLGKETSPELSLIIYYGPENVAIAAGPGGPIYSPGSNPKLTCSAISSPAAEFQWAVNGTHLAETGPDLELNNIQISQSGNYTCIANNKQSLRYSISEPLSVTVLVSVSSVTIVPSQTELVESNSTVSLVCSASGSSLSFLWLNGSSVVTADERIQLTDNNSSLGITSVIRGDTGPYQCEASNFLGKETSPELSLIIYYGPENVAIAAGPGGPIYSPGSNPKLTCSAISSPAAEFEWAVNGTHLAETGPDLELYNIQISQSGNYTCIAHNRQNLRYSISEPLSVTVLGNWEDAGGSGSLSAGVIAAIVIVVLLCVVAAVVGLVFLAKKDKQELGIISSWKKKNAGKPTHVMLSGPDEVVAGVGTIYKCSAICSRTCYYTWNVKDQSFPGSKFILTENGVDKFISLTCTVTDEAHKHFVSETRSVTVINPVSVKPSANQSVLHQQPKVGQSFRLTCDGDSLPVSITWLKDGVPLILNSRMSLSPNNVTLSFSILEESDVGQYQCKVLNGSFSVISKGYWIYLGYVIMSLTGPNRAEVGMQSEYTCDVQCGMDCTVQWALHAGFPKGRFIAEGPRILWTPSDIGQTQVFTCITLNPGAGNIGQVSKTVTVVEAQPRPRPSNAVSTRPSVTPLSLIASKNPLAVGENVTLTPNPSINITAGSWLFDGNIMLFWYPDNFIVGDSYNGRVSFNSSTSQITLYSAQLSNSGLYVLQGMNPTVNARVTLSVQVAITNVSLAVSKRNLVEFNDSAVFTCTASGTPLTFTWYNGSSEVTAANVQVLNNGSGLIINNVTRYDSGLFRCSVANGISNETSMSIFLEVSYGPSNLTITVLPNKMQYISGSSITLSCVCESKPAALFQWSHNNISLNITSPTFKITNATHNQTGVYECIAYNTVTLRHATVTRTINIIDPLSTALVVPVGEPPILNNSFALTCDIMGQVDSVYWIKDGTYLVPDSGLSLTNQNKTLTFTNLTLSDNGKYQCLASNAVSNVTSMAYNLTVNYGPWFTRISGPVVAEVGSNVTLNCSASSQPTSQYSWFFQGLKVAEGSVYQAYYLTLNSSGEYTCQAHNNITGGNDSAALSLTVIVGISSVMVTSSTLIPLASKDMQLFCNVTGLFNSIHWLKNNQTLNNTAGQSLYINGTTLDFQPLQITDDGSYKCVATDAFRPHASLPYSLTVNYGPVDVTITADIKASTILMCNAKSQPPSVYQWFFNNTVMNEDAVLVLPLMIPLGYNYTCVAINPLTNDTLAASYVISERNAGVPHQTSVLLIALCALLLPALMMIKPF